MPRRIRDYGVAGLALVALFVALGRIDDRVPGRVAAFARELSPGRWNEPGSAVGNLLQDVAASPAADNLFLVALLGAAAVLVFLMVRT